MEKPIYNSIPLHFYCVQPIQIESKCLVNLFRAKPDQLVLEASKGIPPEWFNGFNTELYQSILPIDIGTTLCSKHLKVELEENFKVNNFYALSEYLNTEKTKCYLLFDHRLVYFNLVFELVFEVDSDIIKELFHGYLDRLDFYNTVRNILIREDQDTCESKWAKTIKTTIECRVKELLEKAYGFSIDSENVFIEPSTGNITAFIQLDQLNQSSDANRISQYAIELNNIAERLQSYQKPIELDKIQSMVPEGDQKTIYGHELFHFNGRFHTIIHKSETDVQRYMPIQFHMQYMWFYLKKINLILENNYNDLVFCETLKSIETQANNTDSLINKIETLVMHNEKFKLTIESDNERIYQKIQNRWNIENLLANSNRYISYFKDHLNRLFTQKNAKAEQRQNGILIFITIFQFIALISVWADYLALLNEDILKGADKLTNEFITIALLHDINLYMPLAFLIIIITLLFFIFKRPR